MTDQPKNPLFSPEANAIIDRHIEAIMKELEAIGIRAIGAVAGVMYRGEVNATWCVAEGVLDSIGKPADDKTVAHAIVVDMEMATRPPGYGPALIPSATPGPAGVPGSVPGPAGVPGSVTGPAGSPPKVDRNVRRG